MQKKLIALAVAGLMSAPAFAQSNVTLYGTIDYGFVNLGGSTVDHAVGAGQSKFKSRNAVDSGISKANRLGFRGVEDLGNGLKAVFVLESGLRGDEGTLWRDAGDGARQMYAGLAGGFGTVAFGRQYTPQHVFTAAVDPFGKNGLGAVNNATIGDARLDNLAAYISPSWGGFSFIAGWTFNGVAQENIENNGDVRVWAIAPTFTWEKLFVAANYHSAKFNHTHSHGGAINNKSIFNTLDLFGSYDFGFVKLGTMIGRRTTKKEFAGQRDAKLTQFMIGATFKLTPNDSILTSYSRAGENKVNDGENRARINQFAVGYEHALSKRTVLYSQFAAQNHSKGFKEHGFHSFGAVGGNQPGSVDSAYVSGQTAANYRRGLTAGFRHDF
ncbi:MAG: porin [Betaproteobacteria bacterium]|nr:porin [Betaproteobacteria bacterium]